MTPCRAITIYPSGIKIAIIPSNIIPPPIPRTAEIEEVINAASPARISVTDRWEKSDFDRPGFSKETLKYTELKKT